MSEAVPIPRYVSLRSAVTGEANVSIGAIAPFPCVFVCECVLERAVDVEVLMEAHIPHPCHHQPFPGIIFRSRCFPSEIDILEFRSASTRALPPCYPCICLVEKLIELRLGLLVFSKITCRVQCRPWHGQRCNLLDDFTVFALSAGGWITDRQNSVSPLLIITRKIVSCTPSTPIAVTAIAPMHSGARKLKRLPTPFHRPYQLPSSLGGASNGGNI
mmetsp:Transcript_29749/g.52606  ORF Transcript_29749/g.52606 Transcript_29749/m.52606 type:complete len:216 (-) Transcript_29749:1188-1835(-)